MKKFISVMLVAVMALSFVGCSKSKKVKYDVVKPKEFKSALKEAGFSESEYSYPNNGEYTETSGSVYGSDGDKYKDVDYIMANESNMQVCYYEFSDEEDAHYFFESFYDHFEDIADSQDIDGTYKSSSFDKKDTKGYILIDGEFDWSGYYHGAWYYVDNMVVIVCATKDKEKRIDQVDTILSELGFTTP